MKCPKCNTDAMMTSTKPFTEVGSTDVKKTNSYLCVNSKCAMYAGKDLNNPNIKLSENTVTIS